MCLRVLSMTTVGFQSPTHLRNMYIRLMATKQQPHLNMERKDTLKGKVSLSCLVVV